MGKEWTCVQGGKASVTAWESSTRCGERESLPAAPSPSSGTSQGITCILSFVLLAPISLAAPAPTRAPEHARNHEQSPRLSLPTRVHPYRGRALATTTLVLVAADVLVSCAVAYLLFDVPARVAPTRSQRPFLPRAARTRALVARRRVFLRGVRELLVGARTR